MSANDRQVGGDHYKRHGNGPQHWDLAIVFGWDYFQAQVIKYVMRWKDKHPTPEKRLEDLKKARHVLDKYIEEAEAGAEFPALRSDATLIECSVVGSVHRRWFCTRCTMQFTTKRDEDPVTVHGHCDAAEPGPGYVNQG